ncbi:DUF559 domain-containing protein [Catellatospora sp. TT07R-123]|uniref:DUF559 domain-containing protein n=1 Tax=Catellatospora sp. TT07R-123 TaxID=2733863 RepID=UPI001BB37D60|nr:DUF559 domain-containing protein [Catellatospora sp. TT07R-123]
MGVRLDKVLADSGGVALRHDVLRTVPEYELAWAVRAGHVLRPLPRTFLLPGVVADPVAVIGAAMTYAGVPAAVSHLSALRLWGLPVPEASWVHLMTGETRHLRGAPGVRVHRREGFGLEPPEVVTRVGLPVTRIEDAIVDSWPLLDGEAKRAPAITAVAMRMTTPQRLSEALERAPRLAGRRHLVRLIGLLDVGCRSPLELWGHDHVFVGRPFAGLRRQVAVRLEDRTVYLDLLDEQTGLNIELDGAAYHSSRQDRERDLRRDAALTALGFTVVRYSAARLYREPQIVRAEVLRMLTRRR